MRHRHLLDDVLTEFRNRHPIACYSRGGCGVFGRALLKLIQGRPKLFPDPVRYHVIWWREASHLLMYNEFVSHIILEYRDTTWDASGRDAKRWWMEGRMPYSDEIHWSERVSRRVWLNATRQCSDYPTPEAVRNVWVQLRCALETVLREA